MAQSEILQYLNENKGKSFSAKELAQATKILSNSASHNLRDLRKSNMVNVRVEIIQGRKKKVQQVYYL
jgi:DNA-binding MarR family transcriptional regulator